MKKIFTITILVFLVFSLLSTKNTNAASVGFFNKIYFVNSQIGLICTNKKTVFRTTDGGNNWSIITMPADASVFRKDLSSIFFLNDKIGYITSMAGVIYKTTDAGASWSILYVGANQYALLNSFFINENIGWTTSDYGEILNTTDGGKTWKLQYKSTNPVFFYGLYFTDANIGYVAGESGAYVKTTDGGKTWAKPSGVLFPNCILGRTKFFDKSNGYILAKCVKRMYKTIDGGETFQLAGVFAGATAWIEDFSFINSNQGWAVGQKAQIYKTTDGGTTWLNQTANINPSDTLTGVYFIDANNGFAVGGSGLLLRTKDGGTTWNKVLVSGISETTIPKFNIYPNPATNYIVINAEAKSVLNFYNLGGQIVKQISTSNTHNSINISDLPKGTYIIEKISGKGSFKHKFIKE